MNQTNEHTMSQTKTANKQSDGVIPPVELTKEHMTITAPKKRNDKLVCYLLHRNEVIYSETPWLHAVFGVTYFEPKQSAQSAQSDKKVSKQWSVNVSARSLVDGEDENMITNYFETWKYVDEMMIDHAVEYNDILTMGKTSKGVTKSKEVLEALYTPVVKSDNENKYPPRLQPKIMKARNSDGTEIDDKPDLKVYVVDEGEIIEQDVNTFDQLCEIVPKNSSVKLIVQPRVWYIAGKFGVTLQILQLLVLRKKSQRPTEFAFRSDVGTLKPEKAENKKVEQSQKVDNDSENVVDSDKENDDVVDSDGGQEGDVVEDVEDVEGGEEVIDE